MRATTSDYTSECSSKTLYILLLYVGLLLFSLQTQAESPKTFSAKVTKVVDGDTIKVTQGKRLESVRLIGIDAPESSPNDRAFRQASRASVDVKTIVQLGKRSKSHLQTLLPLGTTVQIETDVDSRDRYGRLLAYVYLPSGAMVNDTMLTSGFASPLTIPPNVRYAERFVKLSRESRNAHRGLWADGPLP
jgi:micrococcal nuclease